MAAVSCRLRVGAGPARAVEAVVVRRNGLQAVLACPASCGVSADGEWQTAAALAAARGGRDGEGEDVLDVGCAPSPQALACPTMGGPVPVVFYAVAAEEPFGDVSSAEYLFVDEVGDRQPPPPLDALVELADPANGAQVFIVQREGPQGANASFSEVPLGPSRSLLRHNSAVLVPGFATKSECHCLIDAADRAARSSMKNNAFSYQAGLNRLQVGKLDFEAQLLVKSLIRERLLLFLENNLPDAALSLFGKSTGLASMGIAFSPGEPAVNRYMVSGGISPHTDGMALTLNVPLSDLGAFQGGGTCFWPEGAGTQCPSCAQHAGGGGGDSGTDGVGKECPECTVNLRPLQGSAVLFNGTITHSGSPTTGGVRHVLVASFSLFDMEAPSDDEE